VSHIKNVLGCPENRGRTGSVMGYEHAERLYFAAVVRLRGIFASARVNVP